MTTTDTRITPELYQLFEDAVRSLPSADEYAVADSYEFRGRTIHGDRIVRDRDNLPWGNHDSILCALWCPRRGDSRCVKVEPSAFYGGLVVVTHFGFRGTYVVGLRGILRPRSNAEFNPSNPQHLEVLAYNNASEVIDKIAQIIAEAYDEALGGLLDYW